MRKCSLTGTKLCLGKGAFFMSENNKSDQRQLWIAKICDLHESGMTQEEWCRSHEIPYSTLRYWIRKLKKEAIVDEDGGTRWLKIDMAAGSVTKPLRLPETGNSMNGCINVQIGDFTVELNSGCDPRQVYEVLRILKAL